MDTLRSLAEQIYLGNPLIDWAKALVLFLVLLAVLPLLRLLIARRLRHLPLHESPTALELFLHIVEHTTRLFLLAIAIYCALKLLKLPPKIDRGADIVIEFALWTQIGLWGMQAVTFAIDRRMRRADSSDTARTPVFGILRFVSLLIVWTLASLMLLSNLGVNVTTLVTGLGVGGVAVALAVQNVLGDLLASLAIAFDKPFLVGDLLTFDGITGRVERIGIKSTHLRSIDGEQIILSNTQILAAKLHNLDRLGDQRILYVVGVAPDTPAALLRELPQWLGTLVASLPRMRLERCYLRGFGNGAVEFELWLYIGSADANELCQARERFNLALIDLCAERRITLVTGGVTRAPPAAPAT